MIYFKTDGYCFRLTAPDYEIPVFGYKVGELRLCDTNEEGNEVRPFSEFDSFINKEDIKICTFRGAEDINIIRTLEDVGFKFISTYNKVLCHKNEFKEIKTEKNFELCLASESEYDQILEIEKTVLDYSTFSIDPMIDPKVASERNAIRVKSHFNKQNHRIYVAKVEDKIVGFIQYIVDLNRKEVDTLNLGIHPDYQKLRIGKVLFSDTVKLFFDEGCDIVISDYSTQNIGSGKIHLKMNFKMFDQEIHMRKYNLV